MPDRENVIAALHCRAYDDDFPCWECAYYKQDEKPVARCDYRGLMDDAIALLKEQEAVVRCKDCKHRPIKPNDYKTGFDLEFPDGKCPCQCSDGWYSWYPEDDWFCADGERKEVK